MEKAQQWEKIKELCGAALELDPAERSAFLHTACGSDESLLAEVESLLAAHASADNLSDNPWHRQILAELAVPVAIGPYRLIKKLGEGGMGEVWLGEQTTPVKRQVAIKLIRSGNLSGSLLQRFQWERQSLAMMEHPAIAKVFEAGSTPTGQPYLVMEYVAGLPISDYCDQNKLKIPERLQLFTCACEGVQHAHQKAIIHRDVKPANILVVEVGGQPMPRIIDFGLSKRAFPLLDDKTVLETQAGNFMGTPGYTSPEQANPEIPDVDTRTDVYSLGVVLYLLLTGFLPFDTKKKPLHEVLRQLREEDPLRPSTKVDKEKDSASANAARRGTEIRDLRNSLTGDLDWIVMKALEKDRNRRYGSPSELAADIRRYLNNEAIAARPASASYKIRKYVRRHRVGVAFALIVLLLLASFTVLQARQARRVTRERDRADRVSAFMTQMFKVSDPSESRGNSITAREILDKGSKDIDSGLKTDPELQTQMMVVMGRVYGSLGLYKQAEGLLNRAVEISSGAYGAENPQTLRSESQLAWIYTQEGRYAESEELLRQTLDLQRRKLGREHSDTLSSMTSLATTLMYSGHYPEAEKLQRETLEAYRRSLGPQNKDTVTSMFNLANILESEGRYPEAETIDRQALEIERRVYGPEDPNTLIARNSLGTILSDQGKYADAVKLERETVEIARHLLGPEHQNTLTYAHSLGISLTFAGEYAEAEKLLRETIEIDKRVLGPEHPRTLQAMGSLGTVLEFQGKYKEAEQIKREALGIQLRKYGTDNPEVLITMVNLAATLGWEARYVEAEKLYRKALEAQRRVRGNEHPFTLVTMDALGWTLTQQGRYGEAETLQRNALAAERRVLGAENPYTVNCMINLAQTLRKQKQYSETVQLQQEALAIQRRTLGPEHVKTLEMMEDLGSTLISAGQLPEAEKLISQTIDIKRRVFGPNDPQTATSTYNLACIAARQGKLEKALLLLQDALGHGLSAQIRLGMAQDSDLKSLQGDPRFAELVALAKARSSASVAKQAVVKN